LAGGLVDVAWGRPFGFLERTSSAVLRRRGARKVLDLCVLVDGRWVWVPGKGSGSRGPAAVFRGVVVPADRVTRKSHAPAVTVRVWDEVAGHYSIHGVSRWVESRARRLPEGEHRVGRTRVLVSHEGGAA